MIDYQIQIAIDTKVMMGKPVVKGTRITVGLILEKLVNGESFNDLIEVLPRLNEEQIRAAIAYAAESLKAEKIYPVSI